MLEAIARQVGAQDGQDPEVAALSEATRLDSLARQLDETQKEKVRAERAKGSGSP